MIAVADAKSLYDATVTEQAQGNDDRSALDVAIIREPLAKLRGKIRWIPHNFNPADALTKFKGVHQEPMMKLLSRCAFRIEAEQKSFGTRKAVVRSQEDQGHRCQR